MTKYVPLHSLSRRQLCVFAVLIVLGTTAVTFYQISEKPFTEKKRKAIEAVLFHWAKPQKRVQCQPCVEGVVYDLIEARNLVDLDVAIAPKGPKDDATFGTLFEGAKIRLLGVAEQDRWHASLKLENGERVGIVGFRFDEQMVERKVIIEGCVSRFWNPTWQQRQDAISQLPFRERTLYNTAAASIPGLNYLITPDLVKLW